LLTHSFNIYLVLNHLLHQFAPQTTPMGFFLFVPQFLLKKSKKLLTKSARSFLKNDLGAQYHCAFSAIHKHKKRFTISSKSLSAYKACRNKARKAYDASSFLYGFMVL